ncbi:hypothetical protein RhiirC2_773502 [Rhizophagus irregularis]|nr:hypothetical protein RhiirC2_773502 [Rhizophagus irregularis]
MRTENTTLTLVRKLSQEKYQDLVMRSLEIFNGVENDVTIEKSDIPKGFDIYFLCNESQEINKHL